MKELEHLEKSRWDAIVVGAGMGGAALGETLARAGWKVLFCEQGHDLLGAEAARGQYAELLAKGQDAHSRRETFAAAGRWLEPVWDAQGPSRPFLPFLGAGTGGSSALYGAALERFMPEEFGPDGPWPLTYAELRPWYEAAEGRFGVRGEVDPLRSDGAGYRLQAPPPLGRANRALVEYLQGRGMHPYRLPMALDFKEGCTSCQGYLCDKGCKGDANRIFLEPALAQPQTRLLERCRVIRLEADRRRVTTVVCRWRDRTLHLQGEQVILAAGALATPRLLLASGGRHWPQGLANESGAVGRHLMRHYVDLYALFPPVRPRAGENTKEIAFNDFYFHQGEKLGGVQSFGWLPPARLLADDLHQQLRDGPLPFTAPLFGLVKPLVRAGLGATLCRSLVLATTLEDRPRWENRIERRRDGRLRIHYRIDEEERARIERFRRLMAELFSDWRHLLLRQAENNQRLAHVCGTCRMGEDPRTSVVDLHNKAHGLDNLYIVDAAWFPASGGTNPSLTIAANALRVAHHLLESCR